MRYYGKSFSNLGKKIKALRSELGITQKQLSDGIITRNMLSKIENGESLPSLATLSDIAERLNVSAGYLIDDTDDGSKMKNSRLLTIINEEFSKGNYDLCLQYLKSLEYYPDEKERLKACSTYLLGINKLYGDVPLKETQKLISDALKKEDLLTHRMVTEGKVYRALIDGFSYTSESGREEETIISLLNFATSPSDIAQFSSSLKIIRQNVSVGKDILCSLVFENRAYFFLLSAVVAIEEKKYNIATSKLLEAISGSIPSPIRCYALSLLEKTAALTSDFEKAYSYMIMRKELVTKLLKKVEISEISY